MTDLARHLEKINSELDDCIETTENILDELKIQDEQINRISNISDSIEEKITWSEYLINIINTYFGFLLVRVPKFIYKNNINNINNINDINDSEDDNIKDVTEDNNDFFNKINEVRRLGYQIGVKLDEQNEKLSDQTEIIDKIENKINEDLINQINV
jgi:hypothetical protein